MQAGYASYQDPRLTPPEYWAGEAADPDEIRGSLIEKYRATAKAELDALLAVGEIDEYTEEDIEFAALETAAEYGETPDRIMNCLKADRAEWLAGFYDGDY